MTKGEIIMLNIELEKILDNITNIYISNKECSQYNTQSCDCMELIIDTGEKMISASHRRFGESGCIGIDEVCTSKQKLDTRIYKN